MNLPKNTEEADILDLSLRHTLKNWASRFTPPVNGKSNLLDAASKMSREASKSKMSKMAILISMILDDDFLELYLEGSKKTPYYPLFPSSMSGYYHNGLYAK